MQLQGLRTLIYPSDDLALDTEWWSERLGYQPYFNQPFYVGFDVGGYELGLDPNAPIAEGPRVYFGVDDVQGTVDSYLASNCTIYEPASETGDGIVVATVRRPNGQLVGFIHNPHFQEKQAASAPATDSSSDPADEQSTEAASER